MPLRTVFDPLLLSALAVIASLGLLNLVGVGETALAAHQGASLLGGAVLMVAVSRTGRSARGLLAAAAYTAAALMLIAVAASGVQAFGARRWLALGSVVLQPSELAKVGLLLLLAQVLGSEPRRRHRAAAALCLTAVPIALTLLQPDLSTALLLGVVALAVMLQARVRLRVIAAMVAGAAACLPLVEHLMRPYQLGRLHAFLSGGEPSGAGWEAIQAHIAVASGGLSGGSATLPQDLLLTYLPARENDLAFASLVEQHGMLAGAAVLAAGAVVVWRLVVAASRGRSGVAALTAAGLAALLGAELLLSVGGNLGLLPLAGVPCPLLSAGGTSAVAHLAAVGVVMGAVRDAEMRRLWQLPRWRRPRPRLARTMAVALCLLLAGLGSSAAALQRNQGASLRDAAIAQATRGLRLPASRGPIEDRHGAVLAADDGSVRVVVVPGVVLRQPGADARLAAALSMPLAELRHSLVTAGADMQLTLADGLSADTVPRIAAAAVPGLLLEPTGRRRYAYGPLLAPLLGFVGVATADDVDALGPLPLGELVGRSGLEREYDAELRGRDGVQRLLVDRTGEPSTMAAQRTPEAGGTLRLSLDLGLQQQADALLRAALQGVPRQPRGDEGAVVVMDARDGQLLALASVPAYDDNIFGPPLDEAALAQALQAPGNPFLEHATQTVAPPGSTFKLVVGAADALSGAVPPDRVVPTGARFQLGGVTFRNWAALPPQNLASAIAWSNDVYFYKLALALGPDRIAAAAAALGVARPTAVDLPGEAAGFLGTPQSVRQLGGQWYAGSTVLMGIGQGYVTATPLQVARWTAAVTGGALVTPRLGLAVALPGTAGWAPVSGVPPVPLVFAAQLGPVRDGLRRAVTEGTGNLLRSLSFAAGGKTGTAEDPSARPGGLDAWFTAVAPVAQPEIVVTVMVRGGGEGYFTAEPLAAALLRYYAAHRDQIRADAAPLPQGPGAAGAAAGASASTALQSGLAPAPTQPWLADKDGPRAAPRLAAPRPRRSHLSRRTTPPPPAARRSPPRPRRRR